MDNIGLTEVMIDHGRLKDAKGYHYDALLAHDDAPTTANERLLETVKHILRDAEFKKT